MRLFLVRHGQTSWNISGRAQGHSDIPLDPTGLEQARLVGEAFSGIQLDRIVSSDLDRAKQTAEYISQATRIPVETRKELRERCFGEWEGLYFADLTRKAEEQGRTLTVTRPPGGESYQDVWDRLSPLTQELWQSEDTIAVVSHGGCLAILLAKLVQGTLDTSRAFRFSNTAITELERRAEGLFMIARYNDTAHLCSDRVLSGSLDGVTR